MINTSKQIFIIILSGVLTASCAGRAANPIMVHQYGDDGKSCNALEKGIVFIEQEIQRLVPQTEKTGKNVALGVAGAFLIIPWFFMDLSKAEQMEVNALRQRHNHLVILTSENKCNLALEEIPEFDKKPKEEPKES